MAEFNSSNPFAKKAEPQPTEASSSRAPSHPEDLFNDPLDDLDNIPLGDLPKPTKTHHPEPTVNDALEVLDSMEVNDLPKAGKISRPDWKDPRLPDDFNVGFFKPSPDPRRPYFLGVIALLFIVVVVLASLLGVCVHDKNHPPPTQIPVENLLTVTETATSFTRITITQPHLTDFVTVTATESCGPPSRRAALTAR